MRLEDMTPALVRRAIAIYLEKAWPNQSSAGVAMSPESQSRSSTVAPWRGPTEEGTR